VNSFPDPFPSQIFFLQDPKPLPPFLPSTQLPTSESVSRPQYSSLLSTPLPCHRNTVPRRRSILFRYITQNRFRTSLWRRHVILHLLIPLRPLEINLQFNSYAAEGPLRPLFPCAQVDQRPEPFPYGLSWSDVLLFAGLYSFQTSSRPR